MNGAVLTVAEMRAAEQAAVASGISEWDLMRRAGEGATDYVARVAAGRSVTVLCGPGNNGGDGFVIAESLRRRGLGVAVIAPEESRSAVARHARSEWQGAVQASLEGMFAPVVVDALFGYGLTRAPAGCFANLLQEMATTHCYRVAIDVPSMVDSDTGDIHGSPIAYDLTLALGAWKQAHVSLPSMAMMGTQRLVPIGLDLRECASGMSTPPRFEAPAADAHKYRRGLLAVVAGAMPGAPILAAQAAMRAGAGYVKLASAHSHPDAPADLVVDDDRAAVLTDPRVAALLVGPGLGRDETARSLLGEALEARRPTVLDADALHLLDAELLEGVDATRLVITPHEGELAQLCKTFGIRAGSKLDTARALAGATALTVLAKGPDTILAAPDGRTRFFPRASSWLSVAGTGDVLAGAVASRLAVHGDPFHAAEEGVWLHHEAARIAGGPFTAGELARAISPAYRALI